MDAGAGKGTRVREHPRDALVVVPGVVMEEEKFFHRRARRQCGHIIHAAVAPTDALPVLLAVVLRVHDQHVRAADELDELRILLLGELDLFRVRRAGLRAHPQVGLVVRDEHNDPGAGVQAVADADAGMIHEHGLHADFADVKFHVAQFLDADVAGQFLQSHGKIGALHLRAERGRESLPRALVAENPDLIHGIVSRDKKRKTLDMIPMRVREQQREVQRLRAKFLGQRESEQPDARARVEHDDLAVRPHLHACRVAAVKNRVRPGRGDGAAHAPETHARRAVHARGGRQRLGLLFDLGGKFFGRDLAQRGAQFARADRLHEIFIRARLERVEFVGGVAASGNHHDLRVAQFRDAAHGAADLEAVAARHEQVADDDVGPVLLREFQPRLAVRRFDDFPPMLPEDRRDHRAQLAVVFDE